MKRLSIFVLVIACMFAVVMFSASPSWAYPNPFQAIAPPGQPSSTPTITTATDQSPPQSAIIDWNSPKCDPHVGVAASPPASALSGPWALLIIDCYPNPFNQFSGFGVANNTNKLSVQHAQEVPYVYLGDYAMWTIDERYPNPFNQNCPNLMDMGFSA